MATVIDIIKLAYKDINVLGHSETPSAEQSADALATLNQMIGQWDAQKLYVTAQQVISVPMTGAETYTIGTGASINTALPVRVDHAEWRDNGVDQPLRVVQSLEEYEVIDVKTLNGTPEIVFFQRTYPTGVIYVWPQTSIGELRLTVRVPLTQYTTLTNDLNVPDEYVMAIRFSLAELLAPMNGKESPNAVITLGKNARRVMKRNNTQILPLDMPCEVMNNYRYDIYADN